jgi:hypothetical protein
MPTTQNTTQDKSAARSGDVSARLEALEKERKNEFSGISRV